jgi:hypothetical protein
MPSCGLTVKSPISTPAAIGRSSRQAKIASSAAVVSSELCPDSTQSSAAGEIRTMTSVRQSATSRRPAR